MSRAFIVFLLKFIFRVISRIEIIGIENIPKSGPIVLTGNHIGFLDGLIIPVIPRIYDHPNLVVVVAEKYEQKPFYRWAVNNLNFMFIDRFNADVRTIKKVLKKLENDGLMVISPEGTRSPNAALIEGKSGPAYLASKTGAKIVPFGVTGTEDKGAVKKLKRFKRLRITINIGKPYTIPELPRRSREEFLRKYTDEIMCQIAALLPESYRGIYSEHPRVTELLQQSSY